MLRPLDHESTVTAQLSGYNNPCRYDRSTSPVYTKHVFSRTSIFLSSSRQWYGRNVFIAHLPPPPPLHAGMVVNGAFRSCSRRVSLCQIVSLFSASCHFRMQTSPLVLRRHLNHLPARKCGLAPPLFMGLDADLQSGRASRHPVQSIGRMSRAVVSYPPAFSPIITFPIAGASLSQPWQNTREAESFSSDVCSGSRDALVIFQGF